MAQPIPDKAVLPANFVRTLEFREIKRGDVEVADMPAQPEIKESRFEQGAVCLGTFNRGRLIGYLWFCFKEYEEDEVRCTYELPDCDESVFDFDLFVLPEHRMGIGFAAVWHCANQYLRDRGVRTTYSRLTRFNLASRRSHKHLGWSCIGRGVFLKAGTFEAMFATIWPFVSVSLRPSHRVRLKFQSQAPEPAAGMES